MKKVEIESGELELYALGMLDAKREIEVMDALSVSDDLQKEFEEIEQALISMAEENKVKAPEGVENELKNQIFKKSYTPAQPFYTSSLFKLAASVLFIGSILANIYLLNQRGKSSQTTELSKNESIENRKDNFMAKLPMSTESFEEMFAFLQNTLETTPCKMNFDVTRMYLSKNKLSEDEIIGFLRNEGGHCDCEVLMNISMQFPQEPYRHGNPPPKTHRDADIKLSTVTQVSEMTVAMDMSSMRLYLYN